MNSSAVVDSTTRIRHGSGSPDRKQRRRHSSAENKRQMNENIRRSLQDLHLLANRYDGMCVYKVKRNDTDNKASVPQRVQTLSGKNDETDSSPLRLSEDLCDGELLATKQRKIRMSKTFGTYLGKEKQIPGEKIPNIALMGSGGGVRAMTAMSSVFCTLYDEELLQYILYVAGLSGSSWYLTTLYSHEGWPNVHPDKVHAEIKERVLNDLFNKLKEILKVPGAWLSKLILEHRPTNITELFGLSLGSNLIPDRYETQWSKQKDKIKDGRVPFPILSCIHAKSDTPAKEYHEWVEISPYEVAIPKYGIGMDASLFGSEFDRGKLVEKMEELPLYYINGICGSAFTIINDELDSGRAAEETDNTELGTGNTEHVYLDITEGVSSVEPEKDNTERRKTSDNEHLPTITVDEIGISNIICEGTERKGSMDDKSENVFISTHDTVVDHRLKRIQNECPGWLKDFMPVAMSNYANQNTNEGGCDEVDGFIDDALSYIKNLLKRAFLNTRDFRAAWLNSPLRNLSFDERSPSFKDRLDGIFSRIFEKAEKDPQMCFVDAGFAFNSPYPLVLRSQRSVDLILSFDFTDRGSVNGDPFKKTEEIVKKLDYVPMVPYHCCFSSLFATRRRHHPSSEPNLIYTNRKHRNDEKIRQQVAPSQRNVGRNGTVYRVAEGRLFKSHGGPIFSFYMKEVGFAKEWADLHKVKFPSVPEFVPSDGVKELYILEDENDPLCPVIMHFVLINKDFKIYSSPGVKRQTEAEGKFAKFDLFKDKSCPYNSQNFKYTDEEFERLSELVRFNILNNKEKIKEQIQKATDRLAKYKA